MMDVWIEIAYQSEDLYSLALGNAAWTVETAPPAIRAVVRMEVENRIMGIQSLSS
jgi:hypothetical protein